MIFEQFTKLSQDRTIRATIGMSREKFNDLVPVFAECEQAIQQKRLDDKEIKCLPKSHQRAKTLETPDKRLFFLLYYLKTYPTFDVLGFLFNLSAGHAHDYIESYFPVLQASLERLNVAPNRTYKSASDFQKSIENYSKIMIDGTEVACVRPVDDERQKARYSGKKNAIR